MENKVVLILVDGMRPDALLNCGNSYVKELLENSAYTLKAQTVMPSVTLPCHMSLFHSVDPGRHGVTTNTFTPQVRPINGLDEKIKDAGKRSAHFYTWDELRDLHRPGDVERIEFIDIHEYYQDPETGEYIDTVISKKAIDYINLKKPDFAFIYMGLTDGAGHRDGWMSNLQLFAINNAVSCLKNVIENIPEEYTIIITADHGGHDRCHGTDMPEDMTIPVIIKSKEYPVGEINKAVSIKDLAPTITKLLNITPDKEWEGSAI